MSKLERCGVCRGSKYVLAMGALRKPCKACSETGFVTKVTEQDEKEFLDNSESYKKALTGNSDEIEFSVKKDNDKKIDKRSKKYRDQLKNSKK